MKQPRALVASLALALGAALFASFVAAPGTQVVHATAEASRATPPGLIVGDSMTAQSLGAIRRTFPGWEIDGEGGRQVATIIPILRRYKERHDAVPPVVVIALGSNEQNYFRGVYQYAVDMLPADTTVVFQSPWRDAARWPARARKIGHLARAMVRVAGRRDHTCVSRWRARASTDRDVLIADGVHPTPHGRVVWARTLRRTVERCA